MATYKCPFCGKEIEEDISFCTWCGAKLMAKTEAREASAPVPPPSSVEAEESVLQPETTPVNDEKKEVVEVVGEKKEVVEVNEETEEVLEVVEVEEVEIPAAEAEEVEAVGPPVPNNPQRHSTRFLVYLLLALCMVGGTFLVTYFLLMDHDEQDARMPDYSIVEAKRQKQQELLERKQAEHEQMQKQQREELPVAEDDSPEAVEEQPGDDLHQGEYPVSDDLYEEGWESELQHIQDYMEEW